MITMKVKQKKYKKTIKKLFKAAENHPFISPALRFSVQKLRESKLIAKSNRLLNILDRYNARIQISIAFALLAQGDIEPAILTLEKILRLRPDFAPAYHTLAECLFCQNKPHEAISLLFTSIKLSPQYIEAYFTLGYIQYNTQQLEEAKTSFNKALLLKADYAEALHYLGMVHQELHQLKEAETLYRKAIAIKPDYALAHNSLGFLLRLLNRTDDASASFKIAYQLSIPSLNLPTRKSGIKTIFHIRKYCRITTDILRWSINCRLRPNAWLDYQLLNQSTNGRSTDYFSHIHRYLLRKPESRLNWRKSSLFPSIKQEDLPNIVDTLERDGIYIFDSLIDTELLDEIQNYAMSTKADLVAPNVTAKTQTVKSQLKFNKNEPVANGYFFDEHQMMNLPIFQQFAGDPLFLAIAQKYLGVEPKLKEITCWWSSVFGRNPISDMAQLFHNDLSNIKWLNFFVYVTDVTKTTGPHTFVRGSHKPTKEGEELRSRGLVRISDEDIYKAYGLDNIIDVVGPRGTVFIADTRGYHKGHRPLTDHRLVFQLILVNSLYPHIGKKNGIIIPKNPVLLETINRHPKIFARYRIASKTQPENES